MDQGLQERMELLLAANAQKFKIDESEETQRHRRKQLEDFIMKCCTGKGLTVRKLPRRGRSGKKQPQLRQLVVDIDELAVVLKKDGSMFNMGGSVKRISVSSILDIRSGGDAASEHLRQEDDSKFWLTVVTASRPYEIKVASLKVRDQLLSFLLLLKHVSGEDSDYTALISEPGVDVLRDSISEVRASMSSSVGDLGDENVARSSFGFSLNDDIHTSDRTSCSGRDSLTSVWDAKPAFRRSEANVAEEELEGLECP
jgi:hypothetical protein